MKHVNIYGNMYVKHEVVVVVGILFPSCQVIQVMVSRFQQRRARDPNTISPALDAVEGAWT